MTKSGLMLVLALVASVLVATAVAKRLSEPYVLCGKVYCDTCRFGFETNVTTYIPEAIVELQCNDRSNSRPVFKSTTTTDETGRFTFLVSEDHGDQYCDVVLLKSPSPRCKNIDSVRSRSRVIITNANGMSSFTRHANNLGVFQDYVLPECSDLYRYYFHTDDI